MLDFNPDPAGLGIDRVFDQFLDHAWPLDVTSRPRDLVGRFSKVHEFSPLFFLQAPAAVGYQAA